MQLKKLTIGMICGLGLAIAPMVSQAEIITLGDGSSKYDISLQSHVGNTWTYSVSEVSGKSLSHWNLGIPSCIEHIVDYSPAQGYDTTDGSTNFEGIKWDVEESFTSGTFSITLDADYPETTILVQAKAGKKGNERTGEIIGPNCEIPPCDYIYSVHDKGLNNSQILRYKSDTGIEPLGLLLEGYDIEALDVSPEDVLFGASGDDTDKPGHLYTIDMTNGDILPPTDGRDIVGCDEVDGISFNPADGSLVGWDQEQGLVEITYTDDSASCSTIIPNPEDKGFEIEDLTWDNAGETLYFAYNDHGGADPDKGSDKKVPHKIGSYDGTDVNWEVCDIQAPEIEALEMLNDGTLVVGYHDNDEQLVRPFNPLTCETGDEKVIEAKYNDLEGIGVCLPVVASCPSIVGTWAVDLDLDCDGNTDVVRTNIYHENFTWNGSGFPNGGPWSQEGCEIEMQDTFLAPPIIWTATMGEDGSLSGHFSGTFNGCWTATRSASQDSDGIASVGPMGSAEDFYK